MAAVAAASIVAVVVGLWMVNGRAASGESLPMTSGGAVNVVRNPEPAAVAGADGGSALEAALRAATDTVPAVVQDKAPHANPVPAPALASAPSGAGNGLSAQINSAMHVPRADLAMRAAIARRGQGIPPEVDELMQRRRAGASSAELEAWLRAHPIKDIGARVEVLHWLHEIAADGGTVGP